MRRLKKNELSILLTAVVLGILIAIQAQSFSEVSDVITRNSRSDVFREIQILKDTNDDLEDEIDELEGQHGKVMSTPTFYLKTLSNLLFPGRRAQAKL